MRLLENPRVYRLWQVPFAEAKFAPVRRHGEPAAARRVLDVGCGPGTNARFFSKSDYLGLDINPKYIEQAKRRFGDRFVVADVTRDELPEREPFDFVLVNSLLHHLDTHDVRKLLAAVSRRLEADGHVHILDLVQPKRLGVAGLLARLDRGDFPRPLAVWETLFSEAFEPVVLEPYPLPRRPTLWNMVYFKGRARR
jgi:SAM-dependent methyltransferase